MPNQSEKRNAPMTIKTQIKPRLKPRRLPPRRPLTKIGCPLEEAYYLILSLFQVVEYFS
jgi:hypothetical protein